jgi:hypothetical protein
MSIVTTKTTKTSKTQGIIAVPTADHRRLKQAADKYGFKLQDSARILLALWESATPEQRESARMGKSLPCPT